MFKLLNRFAWIISLVAGIAVSLIIDRDGPFDDEGFWGFIIIFAIIRFGILRKGFIEERVTFFANALSKVDSNSVVEKTPKVEKEELESVMTSDSYSLLEDDVEEENQLEKVEYKTSSIEKEIKQEAEPEISEPSAIEVFFEKSGNYIKNFFSENILAKIGGILIFLCALFFLKLGFEWVGNFGKLIIGTIIGFTVYGTGVWLNKKGLENEGLVLLGIGILINFLVILSGKYLLGEGDATIDYLTTGVTFFFLVLNTIFAVVTSFIYSSRTLLIFGFLCSFINPLFFIDDLSTYIVVGYSLIVSLGGLFLGLKNKDIILTIGVFLLGNMLFLSANIYPDISSNISPDILWITKLIGSAIVGVLSIFVVYKNNPKLLGVIFPINYLFIILLLFGGASILSMSSAFISYMFVIVLFFAIGIYYLLSVSSALIYQIFIFPVLIVLGLIFTGGKEFISFVPLSLFLIVFIYISAFSFIKTKVSTFFKYFFFLVLGVFILLSNTYIGLVSYSVTLTNIQFLTMIIVSFIFLLSSYSLSRKKDLEFLYAIGTILSIFTFLPILKVGYSGLECMSGDMACINGNETQVQFSIIAIIIFAVLNWILPFINKNLVDTKANFKNLLIGSVAGIIFIGLQLFRYGSEYFPGVETGMAFMALAIFYFILSYLMIQKIGMEVIKSEAAVDGSKKNTVLSYLGISISLFSFAIALVFSDVKEIVSTVWLFEATILFYFFSRIKEPKILTAGLILFTIGIFDLFFLLDVVQKENFWFLVPFSIIFIFFVFNLKILDKFRNKNSGGMVYHDLLHILGMGVLGILLTIIIPNTGHGWSILGIVTFLTVLSGVYSIFNSGLLKKVFMFVLFGFFFVHISGAEYIMKKLDRDNLEYLRILQYIATILLGYAVYIWNRFNKQKSLNTPMNIVYVLYLLLITSFYVFDIFDTTFAITMYWAALSAVFIFYGLQKNLIKYRTIGLYLLSLTAIKIFLYDIWNGLEDAIARVAALLIIGILFIVISIIYSKKLGSSLKGEFDFSNLSDGDKKEDLDSSDENKEEEVQDFAINKEIKNIDVSEYRGIKFTFSGSKSLEIRAVNLIKIVKVITDNFKNITFKKGELKDIYDYVIKNYKSELSKANYDKIIEILKKFVEVGGTVEPLKKKK